VTAPAPPPVPATPRAPERPTTALALQLLGEPGWSVPGRPTVLLVAKDAALLALLALDGPTSRQALRTLLWPDKEEHQSAANLRQRLSRLHRAVGAEVVHSGDALRLAGSVKVDVLDLMNLDAQSLMTRGALLAGMEFGAEGELDDWLNGARAKVADRHAQALAEHAEKLIGQGALRDALPLAGRIVELTPLAEHAWRRLMRLHYLRGDRGAALAAFERLTTVMLDELGVQPSPETLQLWRIIESAVPGKPLPQQPVPASVMLPPVMVGRGAAWHSMAQSWQTGRPFVLVGEAGLGKSRLLQEFLGDRDAVILEKARPGDEQVPYAVLGRVLVAVQQQFDVQVPEAARRDLAHIRPELGQPWPAAMRPELLRQAMEEFLGAALEAGLKVVALDDMHDADLATLEALRWIAQSPRLRDLKLALALRPLRSAAAQQLLQDWLTDSQPPVRVMLGPLSQPDLAALLASLALPELVDPAVTAHLFRHAGGHPLYTLATLQDALAHGRDLRLAKLPDPPSVQALLDSRLRELPASTLALLQVAAVGGADLNAERAAALMGCRPLDLSPTWHILESANVLRGEAFTHDLVHEAALRGVPLGLRVALHRQWAELLAHDARTSVGRIAWHWESGERWAEAGRCWHAAGLAARQAGRLAEQRELFEQAARCQARVGDDGARFDALIARLDGLQLRDGGAAVLAVLPELEALADTSLRRLRCHLARAEAGLDGEHALDALAQARLAVEGAGRHAEWRADAGALFAMALAQNQQWEPALEAAQVALEAAKASPASAGADATGKSNPQQATVQQLHATNALAYVLYSCGRLADAVPVQRDAMVLAERLGDRVEAAAAEGHVAALLASVGDVPATYAHAQHAHHRQQAAGMGEGSSLRIVNQIMLGGAAACLGRLDEALDALQAAVAASGPGAPVALRAKSRLALANLWLTLAQPAAARNLVAELPSEMAPSMQMQAALLMARAATLDGAPQRRHWQALTRLATAHPQLPLVQSAWYEVSFQGDAAAIIERLARVRAECVALGLHGTARSLQLRELTRWMDVEGDAATANAYQAAQALVPHGLVAHAALGMSAKVYPPQAWLTLSRAFERAGLAAPGRACRDQGRQWLEEALTRVPPALQQDFAAGNASNRELLEPRARAA